MYKILNGLSPDIMQDIFETKCNYYNTHNAPTFSSRNIKTVRYWLKTMSYMTPKSWNLVPKEMKQITTLNESKAIIKIWKLGNCPCRLCGTYHPQIGFITKCLFTWLISFDWACGVVSVGILILLRYKSALDWLFLIILIC